ncbi:MAG TPA: SprB repeat-containing protein, partial [Chitinophagales bacterium]|nr:SprB repeat-containing protein [Chitinophagales bacterium]
MKLISTIGMAMACLYMALPNTASSQIDTTDCELDVTLAVENDCAAGGSIVATATGGTYPLAYLWDNGSTDSVLTELNTGIYTLIVVDINGCSDTASEDVDLSDGLATNYIGTLTNCNAATGSIELSPSGGTAPYTFLWSTGETAEDLNGLAGGIYIVTVTDANGCSLVESIDVSAPELGVVPTLSADTCGQGTGSISIAINGGNPPFNIIWSTGDTLTALMNLTAGSYSVSVTDSAACEATATVEILELSGPAITTNATNAGCGDTLGSAIVVALGGTGPLTINWSTGDTGSVSSALLAGSYTVTVVDAYGCSAVDTFEITSSNGTAPEITYAATNPGCGETNGAIDVTVSGGTGPFTFDWSSGETTEDLSNLSAGTYMVTVTNADGCAAMATIDLSATGACDAPLNITSN